MSTASNGNRLSAEQAVAATVRRSGLQCHDGKLYWLEQRPQQQGRGVVVERSQDGAERDLSPDNISVRTRVHEYGGGDFLPAKPGLFFVNDADQRIYLQTADALFPLTPVPEHKHALRYADFCWSELHQRLFAVHEQHTGDEVFNQLIAIGLNGEWELIADDADFFASPRISPDGQTLVWLRWHHPYMPWDQTELCIARWQASGAWQIETPVLAQTDVALLAPTFDAQGRLHVCSDVDGFWRIYRQQETDWRALTPLDIECGFPAWSLGQQPYALMDNGDIVFSGFRAGCALIGRAQTNANTCQLSEVAAAAWQMVSDANDAWCFIASDDAPEVLSNVSLCLNAANREQLSQSAAIYSRPRSLLLDGVQCWFYEPVQDESAAQKLIVFCHSGPTGFASPSLSLAMQFWLCQGYCLLDINYTGSIGMGRHYRQALLEQWGRRDVSDCEKAILALLKLFPARFWQVFLRGNSAGAMTALLLAAKRELAIDGLAMRYPVVNLEVLRAGHKFESRYIGRLIGASDAQSPEWKTRLPETLPEQISCPLLIIQGDQDPVVPLASISSLPSRLRDCQLLVLEGEGHGFRRQDSLIKALQAEQCFFASIGGGLQEK